jgi:hypothetical protein
MKKYNKWGAAHKNVKQFDIEVLSDKDDNEAIFRIHTKKEEFKLFFIPNYETKQIEVSTDIDTKFSDDCLSFLINSGDIENMVKQIYQKAFNTTLPTQPQQVPLNLPKIEIPEISYLSLVK